MTTKKHQVPTEKDLSKKKSQKTLFFKGLRWAGAIVFLSIIILMLWIISLLLS